MRGTGGAICTLDDDYLISLLFRQPIPTPLRHIFAKFDVCSFQQLFAQAVDPCFGRDHVD